MSSHQRQINVLTYFFVARLLILSVPHIPGRCVGESEVKCLAREHLISSRRGQGESYSFACRSQISPARVDYSASLKQLLGAAVLACDRVRSYTNTDIPEPLEVPLSSTRWAGIYDPVLIKQSLLVIKPPRWVLLEVHFKPPLSLSLFFSFCLPPKTDEWRVIVPHKNDRLLKNERRPQINRTLLV